MSTAILISEEEYLSSSYDPDCEYLHGELLERNLGESASQRPHFERTAISMH